MNVAVTSTAGEWDAVAELRLDQISSGLDVTYRHVLMPAVLDLAGDLRGLDVLDAGCGLGFLSSRLAATARTVTGVDPSVKSILIADTRHRLDNIAFECTTVEEFAAARPERRYAVVVSNMVLQCVENAEDNLAAMAAILAPGGALVVTVPHPYYWLDDPELQAAIGHATESTARWRYQISTDSRVGPKVTHYYRSLARYFQAFRTAGFDVVADLRELAPTVEHAALYPKPWRFPRYLALRLARA